jgi:hypothetical protein
MCYVCSSISAVLGAWFNLRLLRQLSTTAWPGHTLKTWQYVFPESRDDFGFTTVCYRRTSLGRPSEQGRGQENEMTDYPIAVRVRL